MKLANLLRRDPAAPTLRDPAAPTLRERAAALREGLNRREAVLGAAIAAVPISAVAAGAAEAHPDAALIALWQRWEEARRVERAALARWETFPNARDLIETPEAVALQPGDEGLGIAHLATVTYQGRLWYCVGDPGSAHRASILREPRRRNRIRPPTPEDNLPASAHGVAYAEPWPEAQARADDIVTAWDWYEAKTARLNEASGHDAAEAAWLACDSALSAIEDEIAATEAHTLAGIVVKARLARSLDARGQQVSTELLFEIVCGLTSPNAPAA